MKIRKTLALAAAGGMLLLPPDEVAIITVSDLEARLGVVLLATGDYGVNYLREFFEAPFSSVRKASSYTCCLGSSIATSHLN